MYRCFISASCIFSLLSSSAGRRCDFESVAPKAVDLGGSGVISYPLLGSFERMEAGPVGTSPCRNARGPVGMEDLVGSLVPGGGLVCSRSPFDRCADPFMPFLKGGVAVDLDF